MSSSPTTPTTRHTFRRTRARPTGAVGGAVVIAEVLDIVTILLTVAWLLALVAGYTGQGEIHLLLLLAVVTAGVRFALARRP